MRRATGALTVLAALALVFAAGSPVYADPGNGNGKGSPPPHAGQGGNGNNGNGGGGGGSGAGNDGSPNGANGTVKIHDFPDHKNSSDMANDPKVCQFEIHGFNFDAAQTDDWWVQEHKWGNGDRSKAVLAGGYTANSSGDWTSGPHSLADGHYKLFVEMSHQAGNSGNTVVTYKHKVFKVDCPPVTGGGDQGGGDQGEEGGQGQLGGQQQQSVLGFQQAPGMGAVSPFVEGPAEGLAGAQAGAQVAGQQAAPISALPSTSTAHTPPMLLSALLMGVGAWLMRRREDDR